MGIYTSEDGRYFTTTYETDCHNVLSPKGERETEAAIKIQRWWRSSRVLKIRLWLKRIDMHLETIYEQNEQNEPGEVTVQNENVAVYNVYNKLILFVTAAFDNFKNFFVSFLNKFNW
jgi:hypothetical protein